MDLDDRKSCLLWDYIPILIVQAVIHYTIYTHQYLEWKMLLIKLLELALSHSRLHRVGVS